VEASHVGSEPVRAGLRRLRFAATTSCCRNGAANWVLRGAGSVAGIVDRAGARVSLCSDRILPGLGWPERFWRACDRPSGGVTRRSNEGRAARTGEHLPRELHGWGESHVGRRPGRLAARAAGGLPAGPPGPGRRPGRREDARGRAGDPRGESGVPDEAVPHPGDLRGAAVLPAARAEGGLHLGSDRPVGRVPVRRRLLGTGRVHRYEPHGPRQRAGGGCRELRRAA